MTKTEAARLVTMLAGAYQSAQVAPETAEIYVAMLLDLEFAPAEQAVCRLIATSKFMPTVAEIREMAVNVQLGPPRAALEAWGDVCDAAHRVGAYSTPRFWDPIVADCVALMGWVYICRSSNDAADRARFVELYEGLRDRHRQDVVAGRALPGHPDRMLRAVRAMSYATQEGTDQLFAGARRTLEAPPVRDGAKERERLEQWAAETGGRK